MTVTMRRGMVTLVAVGLLVAAATAAVAAAAGDLDATFNPCEDGTELVCDGLLADTVVDGGEETAAYLMTSAVQSDGKIVVGGRVDDDFPHWLLRRYHPDGALDDTFGSNGTVITRIGGLGGSADGSNRPTQVEDVSIQADGKIVAVGTARKPRDGGGSDRAFGVARYTVDGQLDQTFGDDGTVITAVGQGQAHAAAVALTTDGIFVAGDTRQPRRVHYMLDRARPRVARYTLDGDLDGDFGIDGIATADFAPLGYPHTRGYDLTLDDTGRPVVVGQAAHLPLPIGEQPPDAFALARFTTGGVLDATFATGGQTVTSFDTSSRVDDAAARGVAIDDQGRIIAGGDAGAGRHIALARYTPDGKLDAAFGTDGTVTTSGQRAFDIGLQTDGRILATGTTVGFGWDDIAVVRYTSDGQLDDSFGDNGQVHTDVPDHHGQANGVTFDDTGRLVIAGQMTSSVSGVLDKLMVGRYLTADS